MELSKKYNYLNREHCLSRKLHQGMMLMTSVWIFCFCGAQNVQGLILDEGLDWGAVQEDLGTLTVGADLTREEIE